MSEAVATTPQATTGGTIHDAIDALFAEKAAEPEPAAPAEAAPAPASTEEAVTEQPKAEEPAAAAPAEPKVTASDAAIIAAKARRALAAAKAATPKPSAPTVSEAALKRAMALEAAGDDPLARFKAAELDLAAVVQAYDNDQATNPEHLDPFAKKVMALEEKLTRYENEAEAAKDAAAEANFFTATERLIKDGGDKFECVAAYGLEGLNFVKRLVLRAAKGDPENGLAPEVLPLGEALKLAEAHYDKQAETLAKTKKLASRFKPTQTGSPGIGSQSTAAATAPANQTPPASVQDVINNSIDALLGGRSV